MMEESIFKSCLKRKVKFTASTFVKFLITGTVALSLTACGGGGGGGGSSSSGGNGGGTTLQDKYVEKEFGSDKTISEKMDLSSINADSVIGILAHNSNIKNETEITINDKSNGSKIMALSSDEAKNVLDFYQKNGESFAIFSDGGSVVNTANGKLNITGDKVTGILGIYSDITNEGLISTTENEKNSVEASGIITLGGNVTNKGTIDIHSHEGVGIYAMNGIKIEDANIEVKDDAIKVINENKISIIGEESRGIVAAGNNITVTNNGELYVKGTDVDGIVGQEGQNITIENGKNGTITAENKGGKLADGKYMSGINIKDKGKNTQAVITNDGTINITGAEGNYFAYGITGDGQMTVTNNGTIKVNTKTHLESAGINIENGEATNNNEIIIEAQYNKFVGEDLSYNLANASKGMKATKNGKIINGEKGKITVSGSAIGMLTDNTNKAENNGKIIISNSKNADITNKFTGVGMASHNKGEISNLGSITSDVNNTIGMLTSNGTINNLTDSNGKQAEIKLSGNEVSGMIGFGNSNINNTGIITLNGEEASGIKTYGESIINNKGVISVKGADTAGIIAEGKSTITNEGKIYLVGDSVTGIDAEDSENTTVTNKGEIFVKNTAKYDFENENADWVEAVGIVVSGTGSTGTNEKGATITVEGDNGRGMQAVNGAEVINNGTIKVSGKGAYGMVAETGSTATNNGRIDIVDTEVQSSEDKIETEAGGMLAAGGHIVNNGDIYIDSSMKVNDNEQTKNDFALRSKDGGTITNNGNIIVTEDVKIETPDMSAYIIGTNKDGSYGKVSAETVTVDGNVKVSAEMAKEGYKDSYALNNAIAGKTELGKNYKLSSTSLLYNAVSKTDEEGNLDVELVRNDTDISDLASKEISKVAGIFDSAMKDETLSKKEKEILEKVFDSTSSAKAVDDTIKEFTGYNVYSNIARQIFDTKDMFVSYDKSIIDSLGDYSFNFNFIGNYADVNSKNGTAGYDSKVTGINGAVRFTDSLYGVIGYGYNDVDYDGSSDGTIETIHTGIYKDIKSQFGDIRTGIFGEYNFHETDRKVFGEKADSDFNSYLIGANVEISRKFGDDLYIKPALSFDLSYGKYEDFKEDGGADVKFEKQDYVSAVPAIELKLGKEFETSEIYGAVKYSYELGDLNKEQEIELFEYREDFQADNIEDAQTDVKFGASFNIKNISVNAELGKEFGKRDREYVKAGISYTF